MSREFGNLFGVLFVAGLLATKLVAQPAAGPEAQPEPPATESVAPEEVPAAPEPMPEPPPAAPSGEVPAPTEAPPPPPEPGNLEVPAASSQAPTQAPAPAVESTPVDGDYFGDIEQGTLFWDGPIHSSKTDDADFYNYDLPMYLLTVDTLFLNRSDSASSVPFLGRLENVQTGQTFYNDVQDLPFQNQPGIRIFLKRAITDGTSYLEAGYTGLIHWNADSAVFNNPNGVRIIEGDTIFGLSSVNSQFAEYTSNVHSAEINVKTDVCMYPFASILAGIRWFHLDEKFQFQEFGGLEVPPGSGIELDARSRRRIATGNEMVGFQLGGEAGLPFGDFFKIALTGKAGAYVNFGKYTASQSLQVADPNITPIIRYNEYYGRNVNGVLEGGAVFTAKLSRNLIVRGGYQLIFVSGVALAPEQPLNLIQTVDNRTLPIESWGQTLYHGPFIGFEYTWGQAH
ncbi:MAG: hypothetical protein U1D30_21235 [Planctomycetota bacterium]